MKRQRIPAPAIPVIGAADADEETPIAQPNARPAPVNSNFLGRLVLGLQSGNQRALEATTSAAASMSIGATGAAALRLQLQRVAATRTARMQTLRRVVLSSAAQQRLTLCSALLAEVAQGFGFRLTVHRPDGQAIGARQAIAAASQLDTQPQGATTCAAGQAEGEGAATGDGAAGGGSGAGAADPLELLEPLDVELELASGGVLMPQQQQEAPAGGVAGRPAKSPSASRPRAGALMLSNRLTSAALGSIGVGPKNTAAAQAVQAARRRVLMRAASNAAGQEGALAAAATAAAANAAVDGRGATDDAPGAGPTSAAGGSAGAGTAASDDNTAAAAVGPTGRRIVWDPSRCSVPAASPPLEAAAAEPASSGLDGPPAKRLRTLGGLGADVERQAAGAGAEGRGGGGSRGGDVGQATEAGPGGARSSQQGHGLEDEDEGEGASAGQEEEEDWEEGEDEMEEEAEGRQEHDSRLVQGAGAPDGGLRGRVGGSDGGAGPGWEETESAAGGRQGGCSSGARMAGVPPRRAGAGRLLGVALAGSQGAQPRAAAAGERSLQRAPLAVGAAALDAAVRAASAGSGRVAWAGADEDGPQHAVEGSAGGAVLPPSRAGTGPPAVASLGAPRSRPASAAAGGRTAGGSGIGSPASKLFGAAVRQLQRGGRG
ncbi:hypothetical protein TSOC_013734 [Tetrabaena socialis]|uniref:Uncharacterized protein n=1 Tax=Tetrabaena socialis TaxID=47790 RepID=A0A2J7ZJJ0_9CHLO|nr:hypothetical protein TSOC_013734 [Tetrabaena socialis]|eukprot:PNH00441.1 hypothetical protein TSOC_013734 [Tetrabaena socialis]